MFPHTLGREEYAFIFVAVGGFQIHGGGVVGAVPIAGDVLYFLALQPDNKGGRLALFIGSGLGSEGDVFRLQGAQLLL